MGWLFPAVVESVEEAILNSLFRAETVIGRDGTCVMLCRLRRWQAWCAGVDCPSPTSSFDWTQTNANKHYCSLVGEGLPESAQRSGVLTRHNGSHARLMQSRFSDVSHHRGDVQAAVDHKYRPVMKSEQARPGRGPARPRRPARQSGRAASAQDRPGDVGGLPQQLAKAGLDHPGAMALTGCWTASSMANCWVKAMTAAFEMPYRPIPGGGRSPAKEPG